jgi:tetratricopeptide (TPR) repeat protein
MSKEHEVYIDIPNDEVVSDAEESIKKSFNLPVSKVSAIAQGYLRFISEVNDEDDEDARASLYSLMDRFLEQTEQAGDADDYHNFAVALARKDEYVLACKVIECGLSLFPKNVDLIADYLQYGTNCNRIEECKRLYKTLLKIPRRRWTWRGFAFLIDYIKYLIERTDSEKEIDTREQEMIAVVTEFRQYYPYSEETYRVEADAYKCLNMQEQELNALKTALDVLDVAPKCALRCADILFERGRYEEASTAIKRCISDATQTQSSVNEGYIYYLSALCALAGSQKANKQLSEDEVLNIYSDFNIALMGLRDSSYSAVIKTKTNTLVNKSGIDVPSEYDHLCDCIAE